MGNLIIFIAIVALLLYFANREEKRQENFSVLNKLISGIDNMSEAELEAYEKKISNEGEEEKLIQDLNKASELIGEDDDVDDLDEEVRPMEEQEENYARIEEELPESLISEMIEEKVNSKVTNEAIIEEESIMEQNIAEKQIEQEE